MHWGCRQPQDTIRENEAQYYFILTAPHHQDLAPAAFARLLAGFSTSTNFISPKRNANFGICFIISSVFNSPLLIAFLPTISRLLRGPFVVQLNCACSSFFTTLAPAAILNASATIA